VKTINWEVFSSFFFRGVPMAGSKMKKGKTEKKKTVAKKGSKAPSKKGTKIEKKKAPPKKTKQAMPKKTVKKPAPKGKKTVPPKMKKTEVKEQDFRSAFIKSLESKREELKETLERLIHSRKEYEGELTAGDFIDEVDDAQREISAYSQFSLIERKNKELQKVNYLISRLEDKEDFGLCEECGTPIPRERLLIVPETTLCVACQRELEKMDQRNSMASRGTSSMGPNRREVIWESTEPVEEDDALVEYHIGSLPGMDVEETETPSDDKEEK
jgi:RNA polymerase-binding protein DksA